jgi:hypothetical protein
MKGTISKLVLGTTAAIGMSALTMSSALAAGLTNVQFSDNNFRTYNGTAVGDISDGVTSEAIDALTDDDLYTNVELGIAEGTTTSFSANLGSHNVIVEGVTANDWINGGLADLWVADFNAAYPALAGMGDAFGAKLVERAGDPNVSSFTKDDGTGDLTLTTVGHYNLLNAPWIATDPSLAAAAAGANFLLGDAPLQVSEITKVTVDGEVNYIYSFLAEETGVLAADAGVGDTSSHSGLFAKTFSVSEETADVPEPSLILGLMTVGGLFSASKRKSQNA